MIEDAPLSGLRLGIPARMMVAPMVAVEMVTIVRHTVSQCLGGVTGWLVDMSDHLIHLIAAQTMAGGMALVARPPRAKPRP